MYSVPSILSTILFPNTDHCFNLMQDKRTKLGCTFAVRSFVLFVLLSCYRFAAVCFGFCDSFVMVSVLCLSEETEDRKIRQREARCRRNSDLLFLFRNQHTIAVV